VEGAYCEGDAPEGVVCLSEAELSQEQGLGYGWSASADEFSPSVDRNDPNASYEACLQCNEWAGERGLDWREECTRYCWEGTCKPTLDGGVQCQSCGFQSCPGGLGVFNTCSPLTYSVCGTTSAERGEEFNQKFADRMQKL